MLQLRRRQWLEMVGHSFDHLPEEACGLLVGVPGGPVSGFRPTTNADHSARTYSIDGRELLAVELALEAEGTGQEIVGVMHSHTHTDAYPSPTDVERAALLGDWHFLIVSLRHAEAQARCYRITEGNVTEEPIDLLGG
ncbi:MAG TPA: M67 family metallopeptidase [Acidimicrobiales bacterium]|nr:M67 family metallopeptidase [Acidimicrobiales bacterium]